jgi:positive regulator of sigma E activity
VTRDESLESLPMYGSKLSAGDNEAVHISHIQLILAEKRTSLAVLRTGIVVLSLPLSVVTVLIATSRYYDFLDTYHLIVPLLGLCAGLVMLAAYLVQRSLRRIHNQDVLINKMKKEDPRIAAFFGDTV